MCAMLIKKPYQFGTASVSAGGVISVPMYFAVQVKVHDININFNSIILPVICKYQPVYLTSEITTTF